MAVLLEVRDIRKAHKRHPVLRGVGFRLVAGQILGLVGENGIGKTTLMSILAGDYRQDSGSILLNGRTFQPADHAEARALGIGIIRQHFAISPHLTVAEAIYRESYQAGRPHEELRRGASQLLNDVGTDLSPDHLIGDLQRAERAIVESVRMLAEDASVVIMDEVGASFNLHEIEDLHFIVNRLARQGRGVIYISHRLREIKLISDRIAVLRDGQVTRVLNPNQASTDDIAEAMLSRRVEQRPRNRKPPDEEAILQVRGLSVADRVRSVSFDLHAGEILGFTGPRNSGMHELALGLVGRMPTTREQLVVQGQDRVIHTPADAVDLRIGYFSDNDDEIGLDSGGETIASFLMGPEASADDLGTEVRGLRDIIERVKRLRIKTPGIGREVEDLSGGDRQKIALTKWMAADRDILVLNEPTRGLDIGARSTLLEVLRDHVAAGRSALVFSSAVDDLIEWADRIVVMREGGIVQTVERHEFELGAISDIIGVDPNSIARRAVDPALHGPRRVLRL
jgi:ribose transport system ATP-binding protein